MPSANKNPIYPDSLVVGAALITTLNANRDGTTGTRVDIVTGGTNGTRIDLVRIQAIANVTDGSVTLWYYNGSAAFLLDEVPVAATTIALPATPAFSVNWSLDPNVPLFLRSGDKLQAASLNGDDFNVLAFGGNF